MQELILFSRADLDRSIPSMVDGLKPGQRKIVFACFKRNLKKDIKVRLGSPRPLLAVSPHMFAFTTAAAGKPPAY